jgi:hypothetical protein
VDEDVVVPPPGLGVELVTLVVVLTVVLDDTVVDSLTKGHSLLLVDGRRVVVVVFVLGTGCVVLVVDGGWVAVVARVVLAKLEAGLGVVPAGPVVVVLLLVVDFITRSENVPRKI